MAKAGARFETYVKAAMAETGLPTLAELYRATGVPASTWSGWFRGIATPRRNTLKLVGEALRRTPEQLFAAWDGQSPHKRLGTTETPDPTVAALQAQTGAILALVAELQKWRTEDRVKLAKVEATVELLAGRALDPPETPTPVAPVAPQRTTE